MTATLILGGARSGKSARALALAEAVGPARVFIATATASDEEMADRIRRHQADRGTGWRTLEAPHDLCSALAAPGSGDVLLIDCLTLWLANLFFAGREDVEDETAALCAAVGRLDRPAFFVSNEVGMGLVPETPLGRAFRDAQGRLNQRMAAVCERVEFVAAGLPLCLKP